MTIDIFQEIGVASPLRFSPVSRVVTVSTLKVGPHLATSPTVCGIITISLRAGGRAICNNTPLVKAKRNVSTTAALA